MIESHKRIVDFLDKCGPTFPTDVSIAVISLDRRDNTVSATVRGKLDTINTNVGLDVLIRVNR
jgi:hypothetical protein